MLAADRTAKSDGKGKDLRHRFVNPVDLVRVPLVSEESGVQVAIPEGRPGEGSENTLIQWVRFR